MGDFNSKHFEYENIMCNNSPSRFTYYASRFTLKQQKLFLQINFRRTLP